MQNNSNLKIKKIVLVEPPMKSKKKAGIFFPTGICYIAGLLREKGFTVSIVDGEAMSWDAKETAEAVIKQEPDIVGIACKTSRVFNAHEVACHIKKHMPLIPIVVGGNHVTALPDRSLKEFSAFDIIVIGEGELSFLELINALNNRENLNNVKGIAFREAEGVHITPPRNRISNLDELPFPAYDLLPDIAVRYRPLLSTVEQLPAFSLVFSRGCLGQCTFCDRKVFGNCVTMHSPEYIVSLIKELRDKYGIRYFVFDDDNFLTNKKHLFKLFDIMLEEDVNISFTCQSRVDTIDSEYLYHLKKAGCKMIIFGIESGSQKLLDAMKKNITIDQVYQAIKMTNKAGIKTYGFFIIGYPGETEGTLKETLELIKRCEFDEIGISLFVPLPGSGIYNDVARYGEYIENWKATSSYDAVFVSSGLTAAILKKYFNLCVRSGYLKLNQLLFSYKRFYSIAHIKYYFYSIKKIALNRNFFD